MSDFNTMTLEKLVERIAGLEIIEQRELKRKEQRKKHNKTYSEKNKETIKGKKAEYYQKNKARYALNLRNWRARNKLTVEASA